MSCLYFTQRGTFCSRTGNPRCAQHQAAFDRNSQTHGYPGAHCEMVINDQWCTSLKVPGEVLCADHLAQFQTFQGQRAQRAAARAARREAREHLEFVKRQVLREFERRVPIPIWTAVVDELLHVRPHNLQPADLRDIGFLYFLRRTALPPANFHQYYQWVVGGRQGNLPNVAAPPPAAPVLAQLARDNQNVHTSHVNRQTEANLKILLDAAKTRPLQRAPDWFAGKWLLEKYGRWETVVVVVTDMKRWYSQPNCTREGDWLYKHALDGLYNLIRARPPEERHELYKRAYEECFESINMCCQGHMSRLGNVLVGFNDLFKPPVPVSEILQTRMGAISLLDVEQDEKIRQAQEVLEELHIPVHEHQVWLDAF